MNKKIIDSFLAICKKEVSLDIIKKETPLKIEWIIAIIIGIVMLCLFTYADVKSLTIWSTNFWDVIAKGEIQNYFEYTSLNLHNVPHRYVSGTLYSLMIWAVWNLPIWIAQFFFNESIVNNAFLMLWSKLFLVTALVLTLIFAYKIVMNLTKDKKKAIWTMFLSLTSLYTYIGVFYAGQNDILICLLGAIAIYCLFKHKNKLFYIVSSFAISVKYFFFIPYLAIVLLKEKKVSKILTKILIGFIPTIIFNLVCKSLPMFSVSDGSNPMNRIIVNMLCPTFEIMNGYTLSLCIASLIIMYFIAYITKPKNEEEEKRFIIYFSVMPILITCVMSGMLEFYRLILIIPWIIILYMLKPKIYRINIILDTIFNISAIINQCLTDQYECMFSSKYTKDTILTRIFDIKQESTYSVYSLLQNNIHSAELLGIFASTIAFTCAIILLVINYPRFELKNIGNENEKCERWIIWCRGLIIVPFIAYPLFKMFY